MRLWHWAAVLAAASGATLVYGALNVANRLVVERRKLRLPGWPESKNGYKIALLADMHVRDEYTIRQTQKAISAAISEDPDVFVIAGDFVGYYKEESPWHIAEAFESLAPYTGRVIAVPGNHDYWEGDPRLLKPVLEELGIVLLRNEVFDLDGIRWVGIDSLNAMAGDPFSTMASASRDKPVIVVWHEPDSVDFLPEGAALMLSGHSHGGQFRFPWGWTPMHTRNGEKYVEGFYPHAPTPLYVTRGIGTTGPPSRLGALPEVSILTLLGCGDSTSPPVSSSVH